MPESWVLMGFFDSPFGNHSNSYLRNFFKNVLILQILIKNHKLLIYINTNTFNGLSYEVLLSHFPLKGLGPPNRFQTNIRGSKKVGLRRSNTVNTAGCGTKQD